MLTTALQESYAMYCNDNSDIISAYKNLVRFVRQILPNP